MTNLHEMLLPYLRAIYAEGGNFSVPLLSKPVLAAIDAGARTDPELTRIRDKILEKIAAYKGTRDHAGFDQIFEAYSEGVVYLVVTQRQGVSLVAIPDGAKQGKTPDFSTQGDYPVGLEVKTINVFDPKRTADEAMDRGFETGYEALEMSRAEAAKKGIGIGFAESSFAPHGEGTSPKEAVEQTIRKIDSNIKAGQYEARPTLLVLSLARLGVHQGPEHLRRRLDVDEDCGLAPSGHLFSIAANRLGDPYFDYSHHWFSVQDAGPLKDQGVLIDHDEIPGLLFLQTTWNKTDQADVVQTGFRFHGVWNSGWDSNPRFSQEQKLEAKRVFEQLCDFWNDTEDSRAPLIPDIGALNASFLHSAGEVAAHWRSEFPDRAALDNAMIEADRAFFVWRAALAGVTDPNSCYTPVHPGDVQVGHVQATGARVVFVSTAPDLPTISRLHLVQSGNRWVADDAVGPIRALGAEH